MKERTNEEQLELFADLLEPVGEIIADKAVAETLQSGNAFRAVKTAIKGHKKAVIEILARLDGVEPEEYKVNIIKIPMRLLSFVNSPEFKELFSLQGQTDDAASSGAATENTEDGEQ